MNINVAYYGLPGSFCEQALYDYFPNDVTPLSSEKFDDVMIKLKNDTVNYGILPIENSSTGAVSEIYDLLNQYNYYIVGEVFVKVEHHLLGTKDSSLKTIEEVYSHPQPFVQSKLFLDQYKHWKLVPFYSTAKSAAHVKSLNNPKIAAIGSKKSAELYKLKILASHINSSHVNTTRFIILSKNQKVNDSCNKVSIVLSTKHKAGALYSALQYFAKANINLLKIESRPVVHTPWEYYFYIDFEGNLNKSNIKLTLENIKKECVYFKLLGNYKSDPL